MRRIERIYRQRVCSRRLRVLRDHLAELTPPDSHVLHVGPGDGLLARLSRQQRTDVTLRGIDVPLYEQTYTPVGACDGRVSPYGDTTFDVVLFIDRLHHTEDAVASLCEAARVTRQALAIKDHTCNRCLAHLPFAGERCTAWG